ncbi:MAG TPA: heparan-alpha-glucosaminide N-acetyltransferase domain-containing protein [Pyrinomonadaceae bacterium]|nr:heparan-alpha-glucosaminide N-acetyltransferase domain-containing protein [Pyrinomonadaceae bacterium]
MSTRVGESQAGVRAEEETARARAGGAIGGDGISKAPSAARLRSLDVFRGMTVAGMILVNNPGTWGAIYSPLKHAEWHGWTPTDFVFPFFLFIVGVSITLALSRRAETAGSKRDLYVKIVRRSAIIFGLGLFLTAFPFWDFGANSFIDLSTLRLSGVLNRIAVCYLFAALIFLKTDWRRQAYIFGGLLVAYWAILAFMSAPGFPAGDMTKEGSIASHVDRVVLGKHMWSGGKGVYEPEGILSTLGALATTFAGVLTGHLLRSRRGDTEKVAAMFVAGAVAIAAGWAWNYWHPVNKPLWTSSYVLFTSGMALQLLAVCYWLIDIKGYRRWSVPFAVYGTNALAVFFLTGIAAELLGVIRFTGADGKAVSLHGLIFGNLFLSWASPVNASLAFAVCFVLFWLGVMWLFYRKNIFIKV